MFSVHLLDLLFKLVECNAEIGNDCAPPFLDDLAGNSEVGRALIADLVELEIGPHVVVSDLSCHIFLLQRSQIDLLEYPNGLVDSVLQLEEVGELDLKLGRQFCLHLVNAEVEELGVSLFELNIENVLHATIAILLLVLFQREHAVVDDRMILLVSIDLISDLSEALLDHSNLDIALNSVTQIVAVSALIESIFEHLGPHLRKLLVNDIFSVVENKCDHCVIEEHAQLHFLEYLVELHKEFEIFLEERYDGFELEPKLFIHNLVLLPEQFNYGLLFLGGCR